VVEYTEQIPYSVALDVGFCFFEQDVETVKRAIESVRDHVRYIFAIDGKFEFFQSNESLSSKPVRGYLNGIENVMLVDCVDRKENEKRQQYLDLAMEFMSDFIIILDADEFITDETDWQKVYEHLAQKYKTHHAPKIWGVTYESVNENKKREQIRQKGSYPRIWQRPYLIQYTKTHNFWKFTTNNEMWKSSTTFPAIPDIFMRGNDKLRGDEYLKKAYEYQLKLMKYEKPFKDEYRKVARNTAPDSPDVRLPGIPLS